MGRAGGGSSGGGHFGGGGHSFGSSHSGGHTFGGSGRAGRGSSSGSSFGGGSYHHHRNTYYGSGWGGGSHYYGGGSVGIFPYVVTLIIIIAIVIFCFVEHLSTGVQSTHERTKLTGTGYAANSVVLQDDLGYIDSKNALGNELKSFYNDTGIQPYIYIKGYDPSLKTNDQKVQWAQEYYDKYVNNTNGFMFIYFGSADDGNNSIPDSQKQVGYMSYVVGAAASSVMDEEACEIFWSYIDRYWTSDMSTEKMFGTVFGKTGSSIMTVSKTSGQVTGLVMFGVVGLIIIIIAGSIVKAKFKRDKEKAQETIDILNTDIDTLSNKASEDKDISKYL